MSPPDQRDKININRIMGRAAAPAAVVEYPCNRIRSMGNRKKKTLNAAYRNNVTTFAPRKERDLKSSSGTIGEDARPSMTRKIARQHKPPPRLPNTSGLPQPNLGYSRNPVTSPPSPAVAISAPNQSTRWTLEPRLSGTRQSEIATTATASGRFRKNAHRQEPCSISHPPRTGPRPVVIAVKPDHVPIALPRDFSSKDALIIARLPGTSSAAPMP